MEINGGNQEVELQKTEGNDNSENQNSDEGQVDKNPYKELQGEFDRRNEILYSTNIDLAKLDRKRILTMPDFIQKKVIKELYGLDNINELQEIHGAKFYEEGDGSDDGDNSNNEISEIKRKLKIMEYKSEKSQVEAAIHTYIKDKGINDSSAFEKIKEEIRFISNELSIEDRVKRAGFISYGTVNNSNNNAFLSVQDTQIKSGGEKNKTDIPADKTLNNIKNDLRKYFK